jgi:AbrB family looped-hinge helix DNA binding protein
MSVVTTHLGKGGRLVIPAEYRKALGLEPGDPVVLALEGNAVRLATPRQAVKHAQALVGRYIPANRDLADELIRDRRAEVRRETKKRSAGTKRS